MLQKRNWSDAHLPRPQRHHPGGRRGGRGAPPGADRGLRQPFHRAPFRATGQGRSTRPEPTSPRSLAPSEVVFTSGGTESDNLAIRGVAEALGPTGRQHLIAGAIEHEAVLITVKALARRGRTTTLLRVDATGIVDPDAMARCLTPDTAMVSVMHANNESARSSRSPSWPPSRSPRARFAHRRRAVGRQDPRAGARAGHGPALDVRAQVQRAEGDRRAVDSRCGTGSPRT